MKKITLPFLILITSSYGITFNLQLSFGITDITPVGAVGYLVAPSQNIGDPNPSVSSLNDISAQVFENCDEDHITDVIQSFGYSILDSLTAVNSGIADPATGSPLGLFNLPDTQYDTSTIPGLTGLSGGEDLGIIWADGSDFYGFIGDAIPDPNFAAATGGWTIPNDGDNILIVDLSDQVGGRVDFNDVNLIGTKPIPEPTSSALLALGGVALIGRRRR